MRSAECVLTVCGPKLSQVLRRERTYFRSLIVHYVVNQSNKIGFHVQFVSVSDIILFKCTCILFVAK